jgi:hypothetical protein
LDECNGNILSICQYIANVCQQLNINKSIVCFVLQQLSLQNRSQTASASSHDFEFLGEAAIAERNGPANPEALALGSRDLIAHPLAKESSTLRVSRPMLEVNCLENKAPIAQRLPRVWAAAGCTAGRPLAWQ